MAECFPKLQKPRMRGLLQKQITINICVAIGLSLISGAAFKYFVCDARKKKYADFYRNYDPERDFLEMLKQGAVFQSVE